MSSKTRSALAAISRVALTTRTSPSSLVMSRSKHRVAGRECYRVSLQKDSTQPADWCRSRTTDQDISGGLVKPRSFLVVRIGWRY